MLSDFTLKYYSSFHVFSTWNFAPQNPENLGPFPGSSSMILCFVDLLTLQFYHVLHEFLCPSYLCDYGPFPILNIWNQVIIQTIFFFSPRNRAPHKLIFSCSKARLLPWWPVIKNLPASAGDTGLIPGLEKSPGEGNGNAL